MERIETDVMPKVYALGKDQRSFCTSLMLKTDPVPQGAVFEGGKGTGDESNNSGCMGCPQALML